MIFAFFLFTVIAGFDLNCELKHVEHDVRTRLQYYSKECIPREELKQENCEHPSLEHLQQLYNTLFHGISNVIDSPHLRPKLPIINLIPTKNETLTYGNKECSNRRRINDNELGLCPFHHQIEYRYNQLYPVYKSNAICNCKKCSYLNNNYNVHYGCEKIKRLEPVLRRTEKCFNGLQVYEPAYEYISVACACKKIFSRQMRN